MRRPLLSLLLPLSVLALAACKSPCLELAERVCECRETRLERESCRRNAAANESRLEPDAAAQDSCEALLDSCPVADDENRTQVCEELETPDGKIACGLTAEAPVSSQP
jgi:hypothetical protein